VWPLGKVEADNEIPPIIRIFNTLLIYAFKDGAEAIRISTYPEWLSVEYYIAGVWQEVMRIPKYVWADLHSFARLMAGLKDSSGDRGEIKFQYEDVISTFGFVEESEGKETRLILTRLAPPQDSP
jgi:hypothetical protein